LYVIGSVHLDRNELDKAEKAMRETYEVADSIAESLYKKVNDPCGMYMYAAYGKEGLAQVSLARKDYVHALDYAAEALEYAKKNGDPTVTAKILTTFSDIYLAQDNYKESGRFAQEAMKLYPAYPEVNPDVSFNAAAARLFSGDKEEAYRYFRLYADRIKANTGKQFRETMASMEVQFETEKKELHITNLEQQRILYIFIGIACFVSAILIWIFLRQKIKNEQRDKKLIATNAILEWEKEVRKRFAHDLHEGINGRLSALKFQLGTAEHLRNICDQLDECIETIRRMSIGMMPGSLERYGLKASLEDYCRLFPNVDFHFLGENRRIDGKLELTVYYCAYELVNNAFRHSGASEINVGLIIKDNYVSLTVEDNGCGFDEQGAAKGSGLKSIRDRVTTVNGKIDIDTAPGEGTEISIELKENI
jgi:signal transduction histidine kinase